MNKQKSETYFLLTLLLGMIVITFFVFKPFVYALVLAIVFATVFAPWHRKILVITRDRVGLAALLTTATVLVVIIIPVIFFTTQIFHEGTKLYATLTQADSITNLEQFIPVSVSSLFDLPQYAKQGLNWLLPRFGSLVSNAVKGVMGVFIFLISLYYLFKDGKKLKRAIILASPLQDVHDETIFTKLALAINSVIKGNLVVAVIQGILCSIGFLIFGVPNAVFWGSLATIAALIPGFGTALVITPAILLLFFTGATGAAVGLLIWGVVAVGLIDNFLGPKLAEQGMRIHPFLILLSILGGIGFFGPLGFVLGPLTLSLLFALLEIYANLRQEI